MTHKPLNPASNIPCPHKALFESTSGSYNPVTVSGSALMQTETLTRGLAPPLSTHGKAIPVPSRLDEARWALARLTFITYIGFSLSTLVGGFLTAPLMTWYFFGDWRFWRYWSAGARLFPHALHLLFVMGKDNQGFMFSVPLTSPPRSAPDRKTNSLQPGWPHGSSCGDCTNCCRAGGYTCPLLDETRGMCRGYDSFYWRYFNCGRFPSSMAEIDYYGCGKWAISATGKTSGKATVIPVEIRNRQRNRHEAPNNDDKKPRRSATG